MHVFITRGIGLIGPAVVTELIANVHTVLALARSEVSAQAVVAAGGTPSRGGLATSTSSAPGRRRPPINCRDAPTRLHPRLPWPVLNAVGTCCGIGTPPSFV